MSRTSVAAFLAFVLAAATARIAESQTKCGVERWPVKIGADADIGLVDTMPQTTTVAKLARLPRPDSTFAYRHRIGPVELQTFRVRARLARVSAQDDGDVHLVLRDLWESSATMIAEIPNPGCTADSTMARRFRDALQALRGTPRNGVIEIVGIGFFDFMHGQSGVAPNGLEIHPVLNLQVVRP